MESEVLSIPPFTPDLLAKNMETNARAARFRTLGAACRDHGINRLLLAHHADDQAETVLMRIMTGRKGNALKGMEAVKNIPECYDMHGVYQSGDLDRPIPSGESIENLDMVSKARGRIEAGGVQILRPLLNFEKSRLIATCQESEMPWVEDLTNADPTLTTRNAIRHVFQTAVLPKALQIESLVNLSKRTAERRKDRVRDVERLYRSLKKRLDVRSGTLWVQLPQSMAPKEDVEPEKLRHWRSVAALLLHRILELVSPNREITIPHLTTALNYVFPALSTEDGDDKTLENPPSSFTIAGVLFERIPPTRAPKGWATNNTYLLSRQPFRDHRGASRSDITIPPSLILSSESNGCQEKDATSTLSQHNFVLWDNRFWISVHNPYPAHKSLVIRALRETDLRPFFKQLPSWIKHRVEREMREAAPHGRIFTLPAIFLVDKRKEKVKDDTPNMNEESIETVKGVSTVVEEDSASPVQKEETQEQLAHRLRRERSAVRSARKAAEAAAKPVRRERLLAIPTFGIGIEPAIYDKLKLRWRYRQVDFHGMLTEINEKQS